MFEKKNKEAWDDIDQLLTEIGAYHDKKIERLERKIAWLNRASKIVMVLWMLDIGFIGGWYLQAFLSKKHWCAVEHISAEDCADQYKLYESTKGEDHVQ